MRGYHTMNRVGCKNAYECPSGHSTITVDLDEGVTPMVIKCQHPDCVQYGSSRWYSCNQSLQPTHGFYRPARAEIDDLDPHSRHPVDQGGLLLRALTVAEADRYARAQFD